MTPTNEEPRTPEGREGRAEGRAETTAVEVAAKSRATLEIIRTLAAHPGQKDLLQQLIDAETARDLFDQDYRSARIYAMSGQFDDIKGMTPEQAISTAMSKIRIGRSWGMSESDSIAFIYFTNGKPSVMTEILATKIQQGGFGWDVEWDWEETTHKGKPYKRCTGCTLWLKAYNSRTNVWEPVVDRKGDGVCAWFKQADADTAEIYQGKEKIPLSQKWNWKAWSQDMYFWRAMSRLRKYHLTSIMRGAQQYELRQDVELDPVEAVAPELPAAAEAVAAPPGRSLRDRVIEAEQTTLLDQNP